MRINVPLWRELWRLERQSWARHKSGSTSVVRREAELVWGERRPWSGQRLAAARLSCPPAPLGWVLWPHGREESGVSQLIARLSQAGLGTMELLNETPGLPLEARVERILAATRWLRAQPEHAQLEPERPLRLAVPMWRSTHENWRACGRPYSCWLGGGTGKGSARRRD